MDYQAFAALLGNYGKFSGSVAVFSTSAYLAIQVHPGSGQYRRIHLVDRGDRFPRLSGHPGSA